MHTTPNKQLISNINFASNTPSKKPKQRPKKQPTQHQETNPPRHSTLKTIFICLITCALTNTLLIYGITQTDILQKLNIPINQKTNEKQIEPIQTTTINTDEPKEETQTIAPQKTEEQAPEQPTTTITPLSDDMTTAEAVAAKCLPSVVSINVETNNEAGIGSGVILDDRGNIITNWHVVGNANHISVKIANEYRDATFVGGDESSDIAVININPENLNLTPMEIGDSSQLIVGDWVMTLGSPLGLDQSASTGIVSALYRNTTMSSEMSTTNTIYTNLIQVDAAINGGNSGGALVNDRGQLVGINTLYANGSGIEVFSGIGFAIPGNYATDIANKVIAGEKITHAYLGASCMSIAEQRNVNDESSVTYGAYITDIAPNSPAEKAGLKVGDVIIKIADTQIASADDYILTVRTHNQGETLPIQIHRNGEELNLEVTLESDDTTETPQPKPEETI